MSESQHKLPYNNLIDREPISLLKKELYDNYLCALDEVLGFCSHFPVSDGMFPVERVREFIRHNYNAIITPADLDNVYAWQTKSLSIFQLSMLATLKKGGQSYSPDLIKETMRYIEDKMRQELKDSNPTSQKKQKESWKNTIIDGRVNPQQSD